MKKYLKIYNIILILNIFVISNSVRAENFMDENNFDIKSISFSSLDFQNNLIDLYHQKRHAPD